MTLRAAPGVTILATSRQPLDATGEYTVLLHPLAIPDADDPAPDSDATELFAQRAAAVVDGFTVTENRADVIGICRALDGIPLAIELATVRLRCAEGLSRLPADERWATGYLLGLQSTAHLLRGEFGPSGVAGRLGLTVEYELGDVAGIAYLLGTNAFLAAGQHRYERTALLFGGSAPLWERVGRWYTDAPAVVALHRAAERHARASLGDDRYLDVHARGKAAPLEEVIKLALADADKLGDATVELEKAQPLRFNH